MLRKLKNEDCYRFLLQSTGEVHKIENIDETNQTFDDHHTAQITQKIGEFRIE